MTQSLARDSSSTRTAIVTGAQRGIGRAIAIRLASAGVRVACVDLESDGHPLADGLSLQADLTRPEDVERVVRTVLGTWSRLDILVNNAGIAGRSVPISQLTDADWSAVIDVNLSAVFRLCRAAVPQMMKQKWGRIVNIASIAGKEGNPNAIPYSASKAGVIGLTKALAKELAQTGILVNCVTPAVIETEMLSQMSAEHVQYMVSKIPMGRVGKVEEVAALVAWLCSDECSFSTGAVFDISGGRATY